jgi:flagellar basal body P-ring formation protein FlgA
MNACRIASLHTSFLIVLCAFAALVTTVRAETVANPELALRRNIAIDGASIRLADLFDGLAPGEFGDTVVAYSPEPGRRAVFDAEWLNRLAYRMQLNWRPTSRLDRTIVERTSTIISGEQVAAAIADELKNRGAEGNFDVELSNRALVLHIDSSLPATVEIASLNTDARTERFNAIVSVPAGDPQAQRFQVNGQLFSTVEVPVPTRALRPGDLIRKDDIEWQHVRAGDVRTNLVTEAAQIVGQEARRPLRAGSPIRISDLREPVTIKKGETVTMMYRTPVMLLTASGRASQSGARGDIIRVVNIQTDKTIDARILGPDRVEVIAGEQMAIGYGDRK